LSSDVIRGTAEHRELRRFLHALQFQLWWREALAVLAVGAVLGALAGTGLIIWPTRPTWTGDGTTVAVWALLVGLALAAVFAAARRPSVTRAARMVDRQLLTADRFATAAEILDSRLSGDLAPAQLDDAWRHALQIRPMRAFPRAWRNVQAASLGLLASLVLVAVALSGVLQPLEVSGLFGVGASDAAATSDDATAQAAEAAAGDMATDTALDPTVNPAAAAQTLEDLQAAAAQSEANEAALQKLGDALRGTAAARDVGEALRRGDYEDASNKLVALGRDADQLSRISKRELANVMQRVAYDSRTLDPPLAVAEDAVARALNRQVYTETRSSLENLARTVTDTKKGVVSQESLAKSLEQLQQQERTTPAGGGGQCGGSADDVCYDSTPGEEPKQVGLVRGASSSISVPGPEGDPRTATRSDAGQNQGGDPLGDLTSRLNVPPVDVSVEGQLANDRGRDRANPQAPTVKISDTNQNGVRQSNVVQPGDPVQDVAEQSVEPTANRDAVRAFFKSAGDAAVATDKAP